MATLPADFVPRNFWQRNAFRDAANGGVDAGDCGPAGVGCALYIASMGDMDVGVVPYGGARYDTAGSDNERDGQNRKRANLMKLIRQRAGAPPFGGTSVDGMRVAFKSFTAEFAAVNRQPPTARKMYPGDWTTDFKPDIVAGRFGVLGIWRSPLAAHPEYTGNDPFSGKHNIVVGFFDDSSGTEMVTLFDPLLDGRHPGYKRGPVRIPLSIVKSASDLYTPGTDSGSAGVVWGFTFAPQDTLDGSPGSDGGDVGSGDIAFSPCVTVPAS